MGHQNETPKDYKARMSVIHQRHRWNLPTRVGEVSSVNAVLLIWPRQRVLNDPTTKEQTAPPTTYAKSTGEKQPIKDRITLEQLDRVKGASS